MANINVNEIGYNEVLSAGTANALMVQYKRANAAPMDITEVHTTKQSAENYARNGSTSYAGQIISEAGENIKTKAYKITSGGTLLELIDEETLTEEIAKVVGGGELNLKDYAKTEYVDERDNEILQAAKDYADGITPEIDFSPYYTKEETDNTFQVKGNYTTIECVENKLETLKSVYAPKAEFEEVQKKINDITSTGGEPNVQSDWNTIDTESDSYIKNKPDLTVYATKEQLESEINSVVADVEALSGVVKTHIGGMLTTLAGYVTTGDFNSYKSDVADDITAAKNEVIGEASAYTDTKVSGVQTNLDNTNTALGTLSGRVDTIVGEDSGKTARAIAAEEIAKIVANAPKNLDTLEEIANWITNDITGSAQMANDIVDLKSSATSTNTRLETLEDNLDDAESNINILSDTITSNYATTGYVLAEIAKAQLEGEDIDLSGYATKDDLSSLENSAITYTDVKVGIVQNNLDSTDAILGTLSGRVDTIVGEDSGMTARAIAAEEVAKIVANADTNFDTLKEIADWIVNDTIGAAQMVNDIADLKAVSANTRLTTLENSLDGAEANIEALSGAITSNYATTGYVLAEIAKAQLEGEDVDLSGYATKDDLSNEINEVINSASAYTDSRISDIQTDWEAQIDTLSNNIDAIIKTLSGEVSEVKEEYVTNIIYTAYTAATESAYKNAANDAKNDAIAAASAYTDGQIVATKTYLDKQIDGVVDNVETLSGVVETFSANVKTTLTGYVTTGTFESYKSEVSGNIENAKIDVIAVASAYTDGQIETVRTDLDGRINTASGNIKTTIDALAGEVKGVKDNYVNKTTYNTYTAATETAYETAVNKAKEDAIAAASAYTDGQINVVITNLDRQIDGVVSDVETLSGIVESFSADVKTTLTGYVTTGTLDTYKSVVSDNIATAKNEAIAATSAYTDGQIVATKTYLDKQIDAASGNIKTTIDVLAGEVNSVKENYVTNATYTAYTAATKTAYETAATNAKDAAIAAASAYTDGQINAVKTNLEEQINDVVDNVEVLSGVVESFSANVKTTLTGYVTTSALNTYKNEVTGNIATTKSEAISSAKTYVDAKVGGVQGNLDKTDAALVALSGNVVTIIDNDNGKTIRIIAAEEVAKVVAGADKKFDTLKEIADYIANDITSAATLANDITELKSSATSANTRLSTIEEDLDKVEGDITALSGAVETKYATSADTVSAIAIVNNRFGGYATSASTVAAIKVVNDKFGSYATSADTVSAIKVVNDKFGSYATSANTVAAIKVVNDKFGSYATSANTVAAIKVVNDKFDSYATSAATVTAINNVDVKFKDYATSAATHKAIAEHTEITNEQIDTLEGYVIASANTLSGNIETTINTLSGNLATSISKKAIITTTPTSNKLILLGLQLKNNTEFVGGTLLQSSTTPIYMQDGELYSQSDERLKDFADDIIIDFDKLSNIPKRYFKYKNSEEWHIGTSAQAIREVYPEIVNKCDDGNLSVAYDKLSIIALAAIDKLYNENIELKERLKLIEEKLGI